MLMWSYPAYGCQYSIPYWKHGTQRVPIGAPAAKTFTIKPMVYLQVWNSWLGYSLQEGSDPLTYKKPWNKPDGTIQVHVKKIDGRDFDDDSWPTETSVAKIFIEPQQMRPPMQNS